MLSQWLDTSTSLDVVWISAQRIRTAEKLHAALNCGRKVTLYLLEQSTNSLQIWILQLWYLNMGMICWGGYLKYLLYAHSSVSMKTGKKRFAEITWGLWDDCLGNYWHHYTFGEYGTNHMSMTWDMRHRLWKSGYAVHIQTSSYLKS